MDGHVVDAGAFAAGLTAIRKQFRVPDRFPTQVLAAANVAASRPIDDERVDLRSLPFVTLDPAPSTDLDQAFAIDRDGDSIVLHYAIADVAWFVRAGDPIDGEAWQRALTIYLPGQRAGLHPPMLAEGVASLLPLGSRPAVVFEVGVAPDGVPALRRVRRAIVRSRAKLAYETVTPAELPDGFAELVARMDAAEEARAASRVEFPEQEVTTDPDGRTRLAFEARTAAANQNSALSLATNLAVASAMFQAGTGLFRVMAEPDARAVKRLRFTAHALKLDWPRAESLASFERRLDPAEPRAAAFLLAVRRAGGSATYARFTPGVTPWHAAMAATYAQATAPLRRLADRYVIEAALAVANDEPVPGWVDEAFERLPEVMDQASARSSQIDRAVLELAESIVLNGREGETFHAVVTDVDERGARIQIADPAIVARTSRSGLEPGDEIDVRLVDADPATRTVRFD